jgi:hypothetical protein
MITNTSTKERCRGRKGEQKEEQTEIEVKFFRNYTGLAMSNFELLANEIVHDMTMLTQRNSDTFTGYCSRLVREGGRERTRERSRLQ